MTTPEPSAPAPGRRYAAAAALVVLFALGLRAFHAADRDAIWRDEGQDIAIVDGAGSLGELWATLAVEGAPPLHYVAEYAVVRAFGHGIGARRALSVAWGTLAVAAVIALGRFAFGPTCGLLAGLLAATSPFLVYYSGEIRSYALAALLGALHALALLRLLARPGPGRAAAWGAAAALLAYTHYFAFHVVAVAGVAALATLRRRGLVPCAIAGGVFLALYAPWLPTFVGQLGQDLTPWAQPDPLLRRAFLVFKLPFGEDGQFLAALGLVLAWCRTRRGPFQALLALGLAAGVLAWVVQLFKGPYNPRYLMPMAVVLLPPACDYWARRLDASRGRALLPWAAVVLLVALQWTETPRWLRPASGAAEAARIVEAEGRPGDLVWVHPATMGSSFFHHYGGDLPAVTPPYDGRHVRIDWARYMHDQTPERAEAQIARLRDHLRGGGRVWLVALGERRVPAAWAFDPRTAPQRDRAPMLLAGAIFRRRVMQVLHEEGVDDAFWSWPLHRFHEPVTLTRFRPRGPDEPFVRPEAHAR